MRPFVLVLATIMRKQRHRTTALAATLAAAAAIGWHPPASGASAGPFGTIWVANRDPTVNTIRAFDAGTGEIVRTVAMAPRSEPGDLAVANGKVYVSEERGDAPAIAVVDAATGIILRRFFTGANSRPHHVHASPSGNLVAVGLYGTDTVGVIDARQDTPLGAWDSLSVDNRGRIHAAVFSADETALYLASDASNEVIAMNPRTGRVLWRLEVPGAHELAVSAKQKLLYVSRRTLNKLAVIRLDDDTATPPTRFQDVLSAPPGFPDGLPDTLQLAANEDLLTVGLRTSPARLVVVDTRTFALAFVNLSAPGETTTIAGHQWTSPDGHYTLAPFEGGTSQGVAVIDHHSGHRVVRTLNYPGRPHGIVWAYP